MKIKLVATAAIGAALGAYLACVPPQPKPACPVGHGGFAAKYTLKSGTGPCAELKGDIIGVERYFKKTDDGKSAIAITTSTVGAHVRAAQDEERDVTATTKSLAAFGEMRAEAPDDTDFCYVDTLSNTSASIAALPSEALPDGGMTDALPAETYSETWSNVKIYATANAAGTQLTGDYKLTADGCTATYGVEAIWPVVECEDEDGNADNKLCQNSTDPSGHVVPACGSSGACLNLDFKTKCDPDLKLCVNDGAIPAIKLE